MAKKVIAIDLDQRSKLSKIIIRQGSDSGALKVVELTAAQRPDECPKPREPQAKSDRQKKDNDIHGAATASFRSAALFLRIRTVPLRRTALSVTSTDEPDIAAAAIKGVTKPATASGTATKL